jgi:integral membrane protein (TIGR01906 family)
MQYSAIQILRVRLLPSITWPADIRGWLVFFFAMVFAVALPAFMILATAEYVIKSDWLYSYNWWRNGIPERTQLPVSELNRGADQIKDYFTNDEELLALRVEFGGEEISLYKEREVLHMVDVKGLMQGVFNTVRITGVIALLIAAAGLIYLGRRFWDMMLTTLRWSALGSGIIVAVFSIAVLIDFDFVFTQFHFLSFENNLWLLNLFTDYLLIMFPQRFFFEATVLIAVLSVAQFSLLIYAVRLTQRRLGERGLD